jgi:hypothetical protein
MQYICSLTKQQYVTAAHVHLDAESDYQIAHIHLLTLPVHYHCMLTTEIKRSQYRQRLRVNYLCRACAHEVFRITAYSESLLYQTFAKFLECRNKHAHTTVI